MTSKYSLEIVSNGELVEASARYFKTQKDMFNFTKSNILDDNDEYYVTKFDYDTWFYSPELTMKANSFKEI